MPVSDFALFIASWIDTTFLPLGVILSLHEYLQFWF